ncbi:putative glycoside hydrolase [Oceanobacillus caeni]|uniref:putative glycoside hydrolase n=1 Tax=Oceanobacillus caeni TaxID=405946 RepID=UPI000A07CD8E|nr:putative glycoside hydrolase [Oceanobacillus caeni]PZD81492.1 GTP-binding protein [Bacilli bacterium]MBU8792094.1 putative glycoside hydrolase [Oceanobacillus caeni]MCR1835469.1 putative glycoside hydrolase [Oceanobacillus caeni]PZD83515.1 GTP-binding protein [Bacilli bacterium]PZD85255.1 GTP-binding protein [Bacilli bacterium]
MMKKILLNFILFTTITSLIFPYVMNGEESEEYDFTYPDAVRGIYVSSKAAGSERFNSLIDLIETTDLNTMVIDVKDDYGNLSFKVDKDSPYHSVATDDIPNPKTLMETLEKKKIYPIARVVVFKDSMLAKQRPDLSFTENGQVWTNKNGEAFVNPFEKEVWDYNIGVAKMAAEMGFQEIQFDYVRFPEGFEKKDEILQYSTGEYENLKMNNVKKRVEAVSDFVAYAKEQLKDYEIDVSVDIFGYAATIEEAPGIGQNFSRISENVDVISSMIYPSHWSNNYFGIPIPDKEPFRLVDEYAKVENDVLGKLDTPPISRPWIQDFEAPWLYTNGKTKAYGVEEVEAQIRALYKNGINEFLLWNAGNHYTKNVDYLIGS